MLSSQRKAKDDYIGGKDFSRVRRFDDEARKARIFSPNATVSIDVNKVEEQLKEKEERRKLQEHLAKQEENQRALEKQSWDKEDEEIRKQRMQARASLETCWTEQNEESKERWKHRPYELSEYIGPLPRERYKFQDEEPVREAEVVQKISEAWRQQLEEHNARMQKEMEARRKDIELIDMERRNWERTQTEIKKDLFNMNVDLSNEYLHQFHEKTLRDKKTHDEEHGYEIAKEYFEQFQMTSR